MKSKKYEALYIVSPEHDDTKVQEIADKFKSTVEQQGGTVERAEKWETRKLAFPINNLNEAHYIIMLFEAESKVPHEVGRQMRISDDVIRYRIFTREDEAEA